VSKKHPRKEKAILTAEICHFYVKNIFSKKNPGKIEQQQEKKSKLFLNRKKSEIFFDNSGKLEIFFCIFLTYFFGPCDKTDINAKSRICSEKF
jgi:hypothetical protein